MNEPTKSELEILRILWEHEPQTVLEIHEKLGREAGYTSTLKLIQIMFSKELLKREKLGKKHIYSSAITALDAQHLSMQKFKGLKHEGSRMKLVLGLLGNEELSDAELEELKEYLAKKKRK